VPLHPHPHPSSPRVMADLVRLAGAASLAAAVVQGAWVNAALFALVLLGLVLPRVMSARPLADLAYGVVLLFAAWSAVLDLYVAYPWLDVVVHALACGLTAALAYRLLASCGVLPAADSDLVRRPGVALVLVTAALGCALGVLWEIGEWYGHTFLDPRIQVGYPDTMGDLASDGLGSILAGLALLRARRRPAPRPVTGPLPSVSVVIPVKDDEVALDRCLGLLARQTVAPLEIVVVDNGSRDTSAEVALAHGARVVPEPMAGIPAASATGYDAARGDLIARCDADSVPPVDWVERIATVLSQHRGLDAVTGTGRFYDVPGWASVLLRPVYLGSYYLFVHAAMGHTTLWGSNMALRRGTWQEIRHLVHRDDAELHDDIDLAFAFGPHQHIRYDPRLSVGVSARSLRGFRQIRRRFRRAFRTLAVNWRRVPPWLRWHAELVGDAGVLPLRSGPQSSEGRRARHHVRHHGFEVPRRPEDGSLPDGTGSL
jgi:glycosyltransferase involved in cell wall biosynthesis